MRVVLHDQPPAALPRVAVFLAALVLVATAGWTAGRVTSPPLPVPDLPAPAVLGGPGAGGSDDTDGAAAPVVPGHGGGHPG